MKYEFSCIMLELECSNWNEILDKVSKDDLSENEKSLESEPHITIIYGILPEIKDKSIKDIVKKWRYPQIIVDEISVFENEKFDVIKFGIRSNDLQAYWMNAKEDLENESKFQLYQPHITIAYLKPGCGKKYLNTINSYAYKFTPKEWKVSFGGEIEKEPMYIKFNNTFMKFDEFSKTPESYRSKYISGYSNDFYNFKKNKEIMDLENSKKDIGIKESNSTNYIVTNKGDSYVNVRYDWEIWKDRKITKNHKIEKVTVEIDSTSKDIDEIIKWHWNKFIDEPSFHNMKYQILK